MSKANKTNRYEVDAVIRNVFIVYAKSEEEASQVVLHSPIGTQFGGILEVVGVKVLPDIEDEPRPTIIDIAPVLQRKTGK